MPTNDIAELREELARIHDVRAAINVLHWDQEVLMPPKGAESRGQQMATLSALAHRMFTAPTVGDRLNRLQDDDLLDADDTYLVRETLYDYERATKLPEAFVQRLSEEQSKAYHAWVEARKHSRFEDFRPHLETLVELLRRKADYYGYEESPYDALLEDYERGMTAKQLKELFGELVERQRALVARILESPNQPKNEWLDQEWDSQAQWEITLRVLGDMGYDFDAGRQDKSVHPFTTSFDVHDVRVTTRIHERELFSGLTGSIHEGGHALYEQGFPERDRRSPLADVPSLGMHESQSRLWENVIGRSRPFWKHYEPLLRQHFVGQLDGVTLDEIYRAVNTVAPTFIRVEADECTYNLHIVLRFEIEVALVEGELAVKDVPGYWNERFKHYFGLDVPNDASGCLQDIHWSHGSVGYFPTYALGNLYASQLADRLRQDVPDLWGHIENGDFSPVLSWLREHVHRYGRRVKAVEIVEQATGSPPSSAPYLRYLETKYSELYGLS